MSNTLKTKTYYHTLDGLRGIAAISILIFHYLEIIYMGNYSKLIIGHSYLAVDFFFCLSGFVIGFSYDNRITTIGIKSFLRNRLIRLHPMIVFGTIFGFILYIVDPFVKDSLISGYGKMFLAFVAGLLLIPFPALAYRFDALFPYNSPSWSLFFEYIANIVYALVLSRLKRKYLLIICICCAIWLIYVSYSSGSLAGGWDKKTIWDGFARIGFSFSAGLLIYRFNAILKNNMGAILSTLLLCASFAFPHYDGDWYVESFIVIFLFPLIVSIGAGAKVKGFTEKICDFLGQLSYPLYMTHIPTVWMFGNYFYKYKPEGLKLTAIIVSLILFNLLFAYIVLKFYDKPIRSYLIRKIKTK